MATDHVDIPARYLRPNHLQSLKEKNLRNIAVVVGEGENRKLIWTKNPEWRLLQVYSIQFLNQDREALRQICGTITLDGTHDCFNREPGESCHEIDEKGFVRLTSLKEPIWGEEDYVMIDTNLYRENQPQDFFHPLNDSRCLSAPQQFKATCDEVLPMDIPTPCGTMQVNYAILSNAADCYVTIKLVEWTGEGSAANLYGQVVASDTLMTDKRAKSFVFLRGEDEEMLSVHEGQYIPLQRPVLAVSMGHDLVLDINISQRNVAGPILKGRLTFHTMCGNIHDRDFSSKWSDDSDGSSLFSSQNSTQNSSQGTNSSQDSDDGSMGIYERKALLGNCCKIEVKVFWLPCWSAPM